MKVDLQINLLKSIDEMKIYKFLPLLFMLFSGLAGIAQEVHNDTTKFNSKSLIKQDNITIESRELFKRKGNFFVFWGYNRSAYSKSDINFHGDGYNFTITGVRAIDEPDYDYIQYINPGTVTIPEFNFRMGYYINDKTFLSIGWDHMKYGIVKQSTYLTGTVSKDNNGDKNVGTYNNTEVEVGESNDAETLVPSIIDSLPKGFVSNFEHCDGLNDVVFELGRLEQLWISKNHLDALSVIGTISPGIVIPDSDADILGYPPKHDMNAGKKAFHLAGYSFSASIGLQFDFCKHLFLQTRLKAGYINLPDINTTTTGGKASQHFTYIEPMLVLGYSFSINNH